MSLNILTLQLRKSILVILCSWLLAAGAFAGQDSPFEKGVAITPRNFPAHSPADLDDAFRLARDLGRYAVFIHQWHDLDLAAAGMMVGKARRAGLTPIIGLSPTTLDQGRKELDLPEAVRKAAGKDISFSNPAIRRAFVATAKKLAKLRPEYLCLATEINFLALQRLDEYLHFASLYKEAYAAVKRVSPATKVFVSFQWEWTRILDAKEMNRIKEHSKVISIFRPELDLVALTTYPAPFHKDAAGLPADYYSWIHNHIGKKEPVMLMETGWPTSGDGSESEQEDFVKRLPGLLKEVNVTIVAWALLHDVDLGEFDANLNTVGLITNTGRKKKAYEAFRNSN